jgi:peptidoglycan/LPS O-acetylase OafA/YrhL
MPAVMAGIASINIASALLLESRFISFFTSYWFSWMLGAYIAEIRATPGARTLTTSKRLAWHVAGIGAAALGCIAFSASQYVAFQCWAISFACILRAMPQASHLHAHGAATAARQPLVMRLLVRCGAFSYSLYAIHLPLFVCLQSLLFRSALQVSIWPSLAYMPLAIFVAYVVYRCVERPAIRWSASIGRRGPLPSVPLTPGRS